ncbi:MAG: DUF3050 domain-containing protein [Planctomycetota bacterium]
MRDAERLDSLQKELVPLRRQLLSHPVYESIVHAADLRVFMEHHVFAVWDFMSLLKFLQIRLTCVQVPWVPSENPRIRRMINEIVLAEESDIDDQGNPASHFEMYLHAMEAFAANTQPARQFVANLARGTSVTDSLVSAAAPVAVARFVETTWEIVASNQLHEIAAAFAIGREDIIPDMFQEIVSSLRRQQDASLDAYDYYLRRHMHLDAEEHGPMALGLLEELCGDDPQKWREVAATARKSLEARLSLWDAIADNLRSKMDLCLSRN